MKAIVYTKYGSPDVLQLQELEKPLVGDNQVLIKVQAASANPLNWHSMRGAPFLVRLSDGWLKPKDIRLGVDVAGRVEAVGKDVENLKVGDEVFGTAHGSFGEYALGREANLVLKPPHISFVEAAAVPIAALTALQALRDKGQVKAGQKVLINGASGGVGTYAIQIAKHFGAEVTGVCSSRNVEMVRSLGADYVIDYQRENFTKSGKRYDLIVDNVANHSIGALQRSMNPQGIYVSVGFSGIFNFLIALLHGAWLTKTSQQRFSAMLAHSNQADFLILQDLLAKGTIKSVIDRCYPLAETAEAIRYLESSRARGKVIITVE